MRAQDAVRRPARMSADDPRTTRDDSRRRRPAGPVVSAAARGRLAVALAGAAGVLLLVVATFTTVIQIRVGTVTRIQGLDTAFTGWDRHGPALLLLALVALLMLAGAVRGARPRA